MAGECNTTQITGFLGKNSTENCVFYQSDYIKIGNHFYGKPDIIISVFLAIGTFIACLILYHIIANLLTKKMKRKKVIHIEAGMEETPVIEIPRVTIESEKPLHILKTRSVPVKETSFRQKGDIPLNKQKLSAKKDKPAPSKSLSKEIAETGQNRKEPDDHSKGGLSTENSSKSPRIEIVTTNKPPKLKDSVNTPSSKTTSGKKVLSSSKSVNQKNSATGYLEKNDV